MFSDKDTEVYWDTEWIQRLDPFVTVGTWWAYYSVSTIVNDGVSYQYDRTIMRTRLGCIYKTYKVVEVRFFLEGQLVRVADSIGKTKEWPNAGPYRRHWECTCAYY